MKVKHCSIPKFENLKPMSNSELCSFHKDPITCICFSPMCGLFKPLCKKCLPEHSSFCQKIPSDLHPKLQDYQEIRKKINNSLDKSKKTLENLLELGSKVISFQNESALDPIFNELDNIRQQITDIFQNFKLSIKKTYDDKLKDINKEILKLYEDIREALDFCSKYANKNLVCDMIRSIHMIDLDYQVFYIQEKMNNLVHRKKETSLEAEIRKEYKDKFFVNFHTGLKDLVDFGMNSSTFRKSASYSATLSFNKEDPFEVFPSASQIPSTSSQWLYFFEEGKKNFYYLDIVKSKNKVFERVSLNIPNPIFYNHKTILASNGEIYLLGGYLDNMTDNNEDLFNTLFRYDHANKTLIPLGKMTTLRHSFGMCSVKNKIYAVGGANYKEGALIKCEVYDIETNKWSPINFLNIKSMNHSITPLYDSYIFKFGGMRYNMPDRKELSIDLFERYDIKTDFWEKIKLKDNNSLTISPFVTSFSGCCAINSHNILVFGGKTEKNEAQKQTYLINFSKQLDISNFGEREDTNFSIIETNSKPLNIPAFFLNFSPIIKDKNLIVIGHINNSEKKILMFDSKSWKTYI